MKTLATRLLVPILLAFASAASAERVQIKVEGLACEGCSMSIANKLREFSAVDAVTVDLKSHLVTVQLHDRETITDARLTEAITSEGYHVAAIARAGQSLAPPAPAQDGGVDAEKVWLQRAVFVLSAALLFVIALPLIRRARAPAAIPNADG